MTGISADFDLGNWYLSLFDLGNVEFSAGISHIFIPNATAMVSVWSPSVSYDFGKITLTAGLHFGALGVEFNPSADNFKMGFAKGIGVFVSVS